MRRLGTFVVGLVLFGCGGKLADDAAPSPAKSAAPPPAASPTGAPPPASTPGTPPPPPTPPGDAESTATRDGVRLYLSMCKIPERAGEPLHIWGEVTDPTFQVDEAIIAFYIDPASSSGKLPCTAKYGQNGAHVVFAEARGAEYVADTAACDFTLTDNGAKSGVARGSVRAEYVGDQGARHKFTVDFAAPTCPR
ncbi:MAG: hypothetical protein JNL38_33810 [Myxococcales bacterium]|nr:hypothetical protein [Myxococcales bacterium]